MLHWCRFYVHLCQACHDQDTENVENYSDEAIAYADKPLADEELSIEYNRQNKVREELEIELKNHLKASAIVSWTFLVKANLTQL